MSDRLIRRELVRMSTLRMQMLQVHPFWGHLLLQVKLVPAPELDATAATDCVRHIWFNPARTRRLSLQQLGFVLAHEACHQLMASLSRQRGRNAHLWNCATDHAINHMVVAMTNPARPFAPLYKPPPKILLEARFAGKIAEAIYEYIAREEVPPARGLTVVLDAGEGESQTIKVPNVTDHGGGIDVHLPGELSPEQAGDLARRIGAALDVWGASRRRGHLPADLLRRVPLLGRAQIPWRRLLQRLASQHMAKEDYSLARPNRRYLDHDLVVPGLYGERVAELVLALDTSGSMGAEELGAVATELAGIVPLAQEVTLLVGDTEVKEEIRGDQVLTRLRQGAFKGGGGTDHRPFFAWMEQHRVRPDLFIGLTDLRSRFPEHKPPYPVLWVAPPEHGDAPWGQVIELTM